MGIRADLYNLFKSYGFIMQLYDVDGNGPTLAIEEAEYIYCRRGKETYMVVVNDNSNSTYKKLTIYKTAETSKKDFREMLMNFKRIVAKNSFTLTIKNFGKTIVPKDFSVLPNLPKTINQLMNWRNRSRSKVSRKLPILLMKMLVLLLNTKPTLMKINPMPIPDV